MAMDLELWLRKGTAFSIARRNAIAPCAGCETPTQMRAYLRDTETSASLSGPTQLCKSCAWALNAERKNIRSKERNERLFKKFKAGLLKSGYQVEKFEKFMEETKGFH